MGDVVMVSSEIMEVRGDSEAPKEEKEEIQEKRRRDGNSSGVAVRWERFLQRMMLRVLLVEADDSTRQIIAALLRKCSYRVAAVPDGLKAWELIKGKPYNIDLILMEVDLPSISGFALLTLIMEHDICKNIPVIMMSSHDSISTVYKCMMRGAADYLVKPIRRNELRNLWQHVWRRQTSAAGRNGPQESVGQQRIEVTSENDAASNHSSGYMANSQRNKDYIEKGSDAQSSCTKPDLEAESSIPMETMQEASQPKLARTSLSHLKLPKDGVDINLSRQLLMHESENGGSAVGTNEEATAVITENTYVEPKGHRNAHNIVSEACDNYVELVNASRTIADLIGGFSKYGQCNHKNSSSSNGASNFDSDTQLDLSLRRSNPGDLEDNLTKQRHVLRQSNASAFTRYTYRPLQHLQQKLVSIRDQENGSNLEKHLFSIVHGHASDITDPSLGIQRSSISLTTGPSNHSNIAPSHPQENEIITPVVVKGVRFTNDPHSGYGSVLSPIFSTQSGPSPTPSPTSAAHPLSSFQMKTFYHSHLENHNSEQPYNPHHQNVNASTSQRLQKQGHKLDFLEDHGHISSTMDHSACSSSLRNGAITHLSNVGYGNACGSNSNNDHVTPVGTASEDQNEEALFSNGGNLHRSTQREAALNKFRLKRKDRCYEKKVRYESRKKLAEQRPRVKGQFVRQVHIDPPPPENNSNLFNG